MKNLSNQRIAAILGEYSVATHEDSPPIASIRSYVSLLLQWNQSISLTTVTDPEEIVRFHFGESLFAASKVPITNGRLADLGTGAGFPGLPLKMLIPSVDLLLIESNVKKAAFLAEVIRRLGLQGVQIFRGRMEEFPGDSDLISASPFDFITARAFGQFDALLSWSAAHLAGAGKLILWLGSDDVVSISQNSAWVWAAPQQIPGTRQRFILSGSVRR